MSIVHPCGSYRDLQNAAVRQARYFSSQGGAEGFASCIGNRLLDLGTRRISGVGPFAKEGGSGMLFNGTEQGDAPGENLGADSPLPTRAGFIRGTRFNGLGATKLPNLGSRKLKFGAGACGVTGGAEGKIFHFAYGGCWTGLSHGNNRNVGAAGASDPLCWLESCGGGVWLYNPAVSTKASMA